MARAKASAPFTGPQIKLTREAGEFLSKCSRLMDVARNELASRWIAEAGKAEYIRLYNLLLTGNPDGHVEPDTPPPDYRPDPPQPYDTEAPA